jgi:hypothetical protein
MSVLPPRGLEGPQPEAEPTRLQQGPPTEAERRARWEVRAAQWRAYELAEEVFGRVSASALVGSRASDPLRGLLRLDVPFVDLSVHREREARFLSAVAADAVLTRVPLVYILGPETD